MPITTRFWNSYDIDSLIENAGTSDQIWFLNEPGLTAAAREIRARNFIEHTLLEKPRLCKAIDLEGKAIGDIALKRSTQSFQEHSLEIGYWVGKRYWGKGYATEAIKQMVDYAFSNLPEVRRITARTFWSNLGSRRALEKAGFTLEARFKEAIRINGVYDDEAAYTIWRP